MRRVPVPWVVLGGISAVVAAVCLKNPMNMSDLGIYLAQGKSMAALGGFADVDLWTHTVDGHAYVNSTWLAQRIFHAVWSVAGYPGLQTLLAIAAATTVLLVGLAARRVSSRPGAQALAGPLCAMLIAQNLAMWPELFALMIFAAYAGIAMTRTPSRWTVAASALLVALWTNLHGSFPVAIVLSALVAAGWALERATAAAGKIDFRAGAISLLCWQEGGGHLATAAFCALATLLNPWGLGVYEYVAVNAGSSTKWGISEWARTTLLDLAGLRMAGALVIFGIEATVAARVTGKWVAKRDLPALVGFVFLGAMGLRYVCWLGMVLPTALARLFPRSLVEREAGDRSLSPALAGLIASALLVLVVGGSPQVRTRGLSPDAQVKAMFKADAPVELAQWAEANGVTGNLYNPMEWGSWLTWRLGERGSKTFLDIRLWIYPEEVWRDYVTIARGGFGWEDRLDARGVKWAIVEPRAHGNLIPYLRASTRWQEVYADPRGALIFKRRESPSTPSPADPP